MFKPKVHYTIRTILRSGTGRAVLVKIDLEERYVTLANIYAPNTDNPEFFDHIFDLVENTNCENIIFGGDLNLALEPDKDKKNVQYNNPQAL